MEKIREHEEHQAALAAVGGDEKLLVQQHVERQLDPKLVHVYRGVGKVLKHYRSGKLPRAFRIIPRLENWIEVLFLTEPDEWPPHALYAATRVFASSLKEKLVQRFYHVVLLPRVRSEIAQNRKLAFHTYHALRKATFKPGAFFRGIVLPLVDSGDCTVREATIVGSVIAKASLPPLHAAACLTRIAQHAHYVG
eukprot:CAMPEP_0198348028 /NCGR_PEP_ID=MMETSP1450-20131203/87895_1 /TAXON_ID=753684 ORGANISM="Madagascaria erythrocladiodes, Strain CCMP3234" /NCGR_SAMPLE_ID=MMETSP1450 /ASSEMBLY_ACC=CAM_ASM_001115 /LENGTH=193 /DNA_ID=CAMNT_0044053611 /DNA_START=18 /DNA_END=595 /DNA_ORIENTATION=+